MAHKLTKKRAATAQEIAERASRKFTDGDFEVDGTYPPYITGDEEGVWVPCRLFIRWDDIKEES